MLTQTCVGLMPIFQGESGLTIADNRLESQIEIDGGGQLRHMMVEQADPDFGSEGERDWGVQQADPILYRAPIDATGCRLEIQPYTPLARLHVQQGAVQYASVGVIGVEGQQVADENQRS